MTSHPSKGRRPIGSTGQRRKLSRQVRSFSLSLSLLGVCPESVDCLFRAVIADLYIALQLYLINGDRLWKR